MKKCLLLGLFFALALWTAKSAQAQAVGDVIPDHYIVSVAPGVNPNAVAGRHGLAPTFVYGAAINGFAGFVHPGRLRALQNDPRVMGVTPDRVVSAIQGKAIGKSTPTTTTSGQVVPAGVTRIGAAPGSVPFTGAGVGVAVVDTGVDFNHSDLTPLGSASFSAFGASAQDDNGHGTHVSGTIAARNNSIDVVGVAPNATLYAVKVLDASGSGSDSTVIAGLNWVAQNANALNPPIRAVNMSLGRQGTLNDDPPLRQAVQSIYNQNISVVVAAGNNCSLEVSQQVPATYPEVMAIASTTALNGTSQYVFFPNGIPADTASYFTTDGAFNSVTRIGVTISAPGEDQENVNKAGFIQSVGILSTKLGGGTTRMSGTSMSSPHVAGVVALLFEKFGLTLTPEQARSDIMVGADKLSSAPLDSPTRCYTFDGAREGIANAPKALGP